MTVTQESKQAYNTLVPKLPSCQYVVWSCLRRHPQGLTDKEIAYYLNKPINEITGRRGELRDLGYVKAFGKRKCLTTGKMAQVWVALSESPQGRFF